MPSLKNNAQATDPWRQCFPPGKRLFALPSRNRPRLFAESVTPEQRWKDSRFFPAYKNSARFVRCLRRILAAIHPDLFYNTNSEGLVWSAIEQSGVHFDRMTLIVGTAGPRQKYSIRLLNHTGNVLATVKLGFQQPARLLLNHEAEMLELIPENLGPKLQTVLNTSSYTALILEHVPGHPLPPRLGHPSNQASRNIFPPGVLPFLDQLPSQASVSIESHPAIRRLMDFRSIPGGLLEALQSHNWPIVLQHGDFAPWNLIRDGSRLRAIDWEDAASDGFPFFDMIHYIIQVSGLVYAHSIDQIRTTGKMALRQANLNAAQAEAILRLGAMDADRRFACDPPFSPLPKIRRKLYEER